MHEFFRGWRHKVGCVTLVMACVMAGLWVRSYLADDHIWVGTPYRRLAVLSQEGNFSWESNPPSSSSFHFDYGVTSINTMFRFESLAYATPYWAIIVPLTLVSAYLILWKPRKRSGQQ